MVFIDGPYDDLITTETIDQIFTFKEIYFWLADFQGAFFP